MTKIIDISPPSLCEPAALKRKNHNQAPYGIPCPAQMNLACCYCVSYICSRLHLDRPMAGFYCHSSIGISGA